MIEESVKAEICSIGRRVYEKGFVAANEGNISFRVAENRVLCTPSLHSKGFLTSDDICTVDMDGNQIAGKHKRTSEILLHLEVYKHRADVKSVIHCHPPHATAFAVAREPIPVGVLSEPEIFLGEVPIAPYHCPGSEEVAKSIVPFVEKTNTIVLANHGTLTYDETLERAFWWTDILDSYCRVLILARQIGNVHFLNNEQSAGLLRLRKSIGLKDSRSDDADIHSFPVFGSTWAESGLAQRSFKNPDSQNPAIDDSNPDGRLSGENFPDELVQRIADEVARRLANG